MNHLKRQQIGVRTEAMDLVGLRFICSASAMQQSWSCTDRYLVPQTDLFSDKINQQPRVQPDNPRVNRSKDEGSCEDRPLSAYPMLWCAWNWRVECCGCFKVHASPRFPHVMLFFFLRLSFRRRSCVYIRNQGTRRVCPRRPVIDWLRNKFLPRPRNRRALWYLALWLGSSVS